MKVEIMDNWLKELCKLEDGLWNNKQHLSILIEILVFILYGNNPLLDLITQL